MRSHPKTVCLTQPTKEEIASKKETKTPQMAAAKPAPPITWDQVRQHATRDSCWIVAHGRVYDMTCLAQGAKWHPGGGASILSVAGTDASAFFDTHTRKAQRQWEAYLLGPLAHECSVCVVQ
jgi:nitrate reductase (NAD(P)H)